MAVIQISLPFGDIRFNEQENTFDEQKKFTGHEYDTQSDLTYMGARYYAGVAGKFISQDPLFQDISTDLSGYCKELSDVLSNPQSMNSYAYVSNRPLVYVDPTGEAEWWAWAFWPGYTASSISFWKGVSSGILRGYYGWNASAGFLDHSLSYNPADLNISENNDRYGIIDKIKDSNKYNSIVNNEIENAEAGGLNSINTSSQVIEFENGDLFGSLHGATINIQGEKNDTGTWNLDVSMNDTYDFKYGLGDYLSNTVAQIGANTAKYSQDLGVISTYDIKVNFEDRKESN